MGDEKLKTILNYLLFRDEGGNAYPSDVTAQNRIVRHLAQKEGIELSEKDNNGASIKAFHKMFGKVI